MHLNELLLHCADSHMKCVEIMATKADTPIIIEEEKEEPEDD